MNRRHFIKSTSLAGLAISAISLEACEPKSTPKDPAVSDAASGDNFALAELTVDDLQKAMTNGTQSSRSITQLYLDRIQAIDKQGPLLNSVIELNPDALAIADSLDKERKEGRVRGPLHGIPVLIKDNIDTGDKMMTTAGSLALEGHHASEDAFIIKKLRDAGAVILGKTNLSEWANFRSTRSSSGWSSRGGQTRNPYILDRNPCGSSSGTGTAVSANLCAIGIGTETDGSIGCPSSINGIVGLKPTVGLWSRSGIIPISQTQDTAGPMTRTVRDAAIVLGVAAGADPTDSATTGNSEKTITDYTQYLDAAGLKGKRIGVEKSFLKVHEGVDRLLKDALDAMRNAGAEIIEVDMRERLKALAREEFTVLQYEFKDGLNRYLEKTEGKMKSLKDVIAFNSANEAKVMPYFKQEILEASEAKGSLDTAEYKDAVKKTVSTARAAIDGVMKEHKLDAVCGPTNGPSWCTDPVNGDFFTGYGTYSAAAMAGYPHISVPMGVVEELPVGLTFLAGAWQEPVLVTIGYAYEQVSKKRSVPAFRRTLT
jgi:amidase